MISNLQEGIWKKVEFENGTLYWEAELGKQLLDRHNDNGGYGGQLFELKLEDGSRTEIKGPWSSRPDVVRQFGDISFIGYDEQLLEEGVVLYQPGGGNTWCCLYDYTGKMGLEYHFKEDKDGMWTFDYGRSVNDY